jgi:hypothetical protein
MLKSKFGAAVAMAIIGVLLVAGVASAITIVVDGAKEVAWNGAGGQTPGIQTDPDEATIDNRYDIKEFRWTNDALMTSPWGHMYFLVETFGNLDVNYPPLAPQIIICVNTDNNTTTGNTASGYCNDMAGIDRKITVNLVALSVLVQRWTGTAWATVAQPVGGMRSVAWQDTGGVGIADLPYVEIGVDLQSLGVINGATCLSAMPTAIYYDNGMVDPEDAVPGVGTFNIGCGSPTAIALNNLQAKADAQNNTAVIILATSIVATLGLAGVVISRRHRTA